MPKCTSRMKGASKIDLLRIVALGKMGWKSELPEIGPVGLQPASSFKFSCVCAPIALWCFVLKRTTLLTVDLSSTLCKKCVVSKSRPLYFKR